MPVEYRVIEGTRRVFTMCVHVCKDDGSVYRHICWWLLVGSAVEDHSNRSIQVDCIHCGGGGGLGISTLDLDI